MSADLARKSPASYAIGIATGLMCALAAGAVWCVLQLYLRFDLIGISLAVAAFIAWILRRQGFGRTPSGALIAAISTTIACVYASYLLAAAKVASFLGIPMRSTLTTIGPDMAGAVAWADLTGFHIGTMVLAVVLSAWLVWRKA
ncbi:MAG TPA: hypothetical protein PKC03_10065 [Dokdonella sp.]|jgi:hypothetical protein|nr:hypothetical protein [Dokdonella sp.]